MSFTRRHVPRLFLLVGCGLLLFVPQAKAEFGVEPGSFHADVLDAGRVPLAAPQAGGHPFVQRVRFRFNTKPNPFPTGGPEPIPDGAVKDVSVDLPPGLLGSPHSIPQCTVAEFIPPGWGGLPRCPTDTQIGVVNIDFGLGPGFHQEQRTPLYNLVPGAGAAARFGFVPTTPVVIDFHVRTGGDYGVTATVLNTSQSINIYGVELEVWGVPADHAHDSERYLPGNWQPGDGTGNPLPSGLAPTPFLDLPTDCRSARTTKLDVTSWQEPERNRAYESEPQAFGGCQKLDFEPSVEVRPEGSEAGEPAGLGVDIKVPQSDAPYGVVSPAVKSTTLTLPRGMAVNPSSANGLTGCTPEQIGLDTSDPATCPTSSKVGSVRIDTPLLGNPLEGGVYLATQGSNPFRSLLALYLVAVEPETGVLVKLAGKVSPDPTTGQLTTTFEDTPQVPFERLHLQLKGGPDAPLLLPSTCGTYTARAAMASWAAPDETVVSEPSFTVDRNCAASARFSPGFEAGTADPTAGRFSPFLLRVTRGDGEAGLSRLAATLPEGLLARLAGVPLCPEAEAPTGACPPASRVGGVTVGVGAGPSPLFVPEPGRAPTALYLAGPYEGAPYSLVAVVPAQAGPFDLGTVVVRDALRVDPVSTRVTAESDPLPRILEGIPISYRDLRVEVDRPGFTRNPTSCGAAAVESTLTSTDGRTASPAARFATADCAALAFSPRLSLRLAGPTRRGRFPALTATLRMPAEGQAGLSRVQVTLPHSEFLEQAHIGTVCTRVQYAAHACPARSVYGHARAYTPLLDRPLEGPVYLRSSDHTLPDLVASLDGPIHVDLAARIDSRHQGIRTTFSSLPDAPVTRFVLQMQGGRKGLLVNSRDLCAAGTGRATVAIDAQNGRSHDSRPRPATGCGGRKGGK